MEDAGEYPVVINFRLDETRGTTSRQWKLDGGNGDSEDGGPDLCGNHQER